MSGYRRRGELARPTPVDAPERHARTARSLPVFAALVSLAFVSVAGVPHASSLTLAADGTPSVALGSQEFTAAHSAAIEIDRDGYGVTDPPPPQVAAAPAAGKPDPGSAKAIAYDMVIAKGWGEGEYSCLVALWQKESNWNVYAANPTSGAYGIPQALPGTKMAAAGSDWRTSARTQIKWGLGYIEGRYKTPCGAWESSQTRGWY